MIYDKLVRDRIPEILDSLGKKYTHHIANSDEYGQKLWKKLDEEVQEFHEKPCLEEMADIMEVLAAITDFYGLDLYEVETARQAKEAAKGAFTEQIILGEVSDK